MTWKKEAESLKQRMAIAPQGCQTVEEIAHELELSVDRAVDVIRRLIKDGRAEAVSGKKLTPHGSLINTYYYRLLPTKAAKVK